MKLLENKKILITGLLSDRSIAYGVAKSCHEHGATLAFTYQNERFIDRIQNFAKEFSSDLIFKCDVSNNDDMINLCKDIERKWDAIDGLLHSIAFSPKEGLSGDFIDNVDRDTYNISNDISAYSFLALSKYLKPLLIKGKASLVTLTYLGGEKVVPNYNMAGVAKAALEATMRYMAYSLGGHQVRVNAISAGPIKTLAASGISGFSKILSHVEKVAPLKRNITTSEVGNVASFLFSNLASGITGETIFVDAGYNIMAIGTNDA